MGSSRILFETSESVDVGFLICLLNAIIGVCRIISEGLCFHLLVARFFL